MSQKVHLSNLLNFSPKQKEASEAVDDHRFVLYGGAMGGGKSYFLRWQAIKLLLDWYQQGHENVEVGLFCENYPALKDRQLSKIGTEFPSWLGNLHSDHKIHGKAFILEPEYGSGVIKFRNLDDPSKYQSAEFAAELVDELTKNPEDTFIDLRHRLRWSGIDNTKFIAATNPGGTGHAWVKKLWMDRVFDENEEEEDQYKYVQALAEDNPHLSKEYLKSLDSLPADKRRAYRDGDWDVFKGQYFTEFSRNLHVCEPFKIPPEWRRFLMGDYGYAAPSAIYWAATNPEGQIYLYRELYVKEHTYSQLADAIISLTQPDEDIKYWVFDPAIWARRGEVDGALSGAQIMQDRYLQVRKKHLNLIRGNNDRINGWIELREWLKPYVEEEEVKSRFNVFNTCTNFIRTFPSLVYDQNRVEDIDTDGDDHAADSVRYGIMSSPVPARSKEQEAEAFFRKKMKKNRRKQMANRFG